jgi:trans-2-enoyl-CoA reductase
MVTYGGMSRKPVTVPTSALIFKDVQLRGFWLTRWVEQHTLAERQAMLDDLFDMIKTGKLKLLMESWKFNEFFAALEKAKQPAKDRKVVLAF